MKTFKVWELEINLSVSDVLTIGTMRKLYPIVADTEKGWEIEMIINFIIAFSDDADIEKKLNELPGNLLTELTEQTSKILDPLLKQLTPSKKKS